MRIYLSPQRRDDSINVSKVGDVLTIGGEEFDFTGLGENEELTSDIVSCEWIVGPVRRINGEIHLTLILPHGPNPSHAVARPEPITVIEDGPVALPHDVNNRSVVK